MVVVYLLSHIQGYRLETAGCQALLFMLFFTQEFWSGLPFPSPADSPHLRIQPISPACSQLFTAEPPESPHNIFLLLTYFICTSLYLLTPTNNLSMPTSLSPLKTTSLFNMSVSLFQLCIHIHLLNTTFLPSIH